MAFSNLRYALRLSVGLICLFGYSELTAGDVWGKIFRYELCGNPPVPCQITAWSGANSRLVRLDIPYTTLDPTRTPDPTTGFFQFQNIQDNVTGWKLFGYANITSGPLLTVGEYLAVHTIPGNGGFQWVEMKKSTSIRTENVHAIPNATVFFSWTGIGVSWSYTEPYPALGFIVARNGVDIATVGTNQNYYLDEDWVFGITHYYSARPYFNSPVGGPAIDGGATGAQETITPGYTLVGPATLPNQEMGEWKAYYGPEAIWEWRFRINGQGAWSQIIGTSWKVTMQMPCCKFLEMQFTATVGTRIWTGTFRTDMVVGKCVPSVEKPNQGKVARFGLQQNHPNPFNPLTLIKYDLPFDELVTLKVYDLLGNEVRTLVNEFQNAGEHQANFDGSGLASGVYLYTLRTRSGWETKKLILQK